MIIVSLQKASHLTWKLEEVTILKWETANENLPSTGKESFKFCVDSFIYFFFLSKVPFYLEYNVGWISLEKYKLYFYYHINPQSKCWEDIKYKTGQL